MKITRSADLPFAPALDQGKFSNTRKGLAPPEAKLQAGMWQLPPSKRSFPMHMHHVTEEAMYVISGKAKIRTPDGETAIGPGDYIAFPAGGIAHQIINDGTETLTYMGFSVNTAGSDIVEYPDSDKVSSSVGAPPNTKRFIFKKDTAAGYFDGEKDAEP